MIEALKPKQSLKAAELQDGDIVCFQRNVERKGDKKDESYVMASLDIDMMSTDPWQSETDGSIRGCSRLLRFPPPQEDGQISRTPYPLQRREIPAL